MLFFIHTFILHLLACDPSESDPVTGINPGCNYAGICYPIGNRGICLCCVPDSQADNNYCGEHWSCDRDNPSETCIRYSGNRCTDIEQYLRAAFGFRADDTIPGAPSDMVCYTDPYERDVLWKWNVSSVDIGPQVSYIAEKYGWTGTVKTVPTCDSCSPAHPCTLGIEQDLNVTEGSTYGFQIDFNEHYNISCGVPGIFYAEDLQPECEYNFDFGQEGHLVWEETRGDIGKGDATFLDALNDLLWAEPDPSNEGLGLGWTNTRMIAMGEQVIKKNLGEMYLTLSPTDLPTSSPTENPTASPTEVPSTPPTENPTVSPTEVPSTPPTQNPTVLPTEVPTVSPTQSPSTTTGCGPYINHVEDLVFQGVGSNCRAGLNASWPGGLSCSSPYVVCLPKENTPGAFGGEPYKSKTYRYSVDECLHECANDQRCLGVEFVADSSSILGDCNLIDDIPLEIDNAVIGFNYNPEISYSNLDSTVTNGDALCFAKQDACNPYFEAEDLSDDMLNCYCPNNRKGYYTKKVKRTFNNTRFCGDDPEIEMRIQKAQANRMFHLCENWCLFLTDDPAAESWYWDPWKTCFREQYAGVGEHMAYCTRVIRNPDTVEMQFVIHRSTVCQNEKPTEVPSVLASSWFIAIEEASCDHVCHSHGLVCDENLVASVVNPTSQTEMYFTEAGVACESIAIGEEGWALPGYHTSSQTCLVRNTATESTPCNWAIGVGYRRLCACA